MRLPGFHFHEDMSGTWTADDRVAQRAFRNVLDRPFGRGDDTPGSVAPVQSAYAARSSSKARSSWLSAARSSGSRSGGLTLHAVS